MQIWTSLPFFHSTWLLWYKLSLAILAIYAPAGPFMIMAMFTQRARASKRRAAGSAPVKPVDGLVFPLTAKGDRSTTAAGKRIFADAIRGVDAAAADAVERERNWRFGYQKHVVRNVETSFQSPKAALDIAAHGLESAFRTFEFVRDGKTTSLETAMREYTGSFETGFIKGEAPRTTGRALRIPYKGGVLEGDALKAQLDRYVAALARSVALAGKRGLRGEQRARLVSRATS